MGSHPILIGVALSGQESKIIPLTGPNPSVLPVNVIWILIIRLRDIVSFYSFP